MCRLRHNARPSWHRCQVYQVERSKSTVFFVARMAHRGIRPPTSKGRGKPALFILGARRVRVGRSALKNARRLIFASDRGARERAFANGRQPIRRARRSRPYSAANELSPASPRQLTHHVCKASLLLPSLRAAGPLGGCLVPGGYCLIQKATDRRSFGSGTRKEVP